MIPVSVSVSPGPPEFFDLLVRTSGPVLLGLSRAVQTLFRKSMSDVLPVGTTVTMFLRRLVGANIVDYVVQLRDTRGCVVGRKDGLVTRDFPAHGLLVFGSTVMVRLDLPEQPATLAEFLPPVVPLSVPLPPAGGMVSSGLLQAIPSVASSVPSLPFAGAVPGPSD